MLSAGASERFSGEPKALLSVGPESAIARVVRVASAAGSRVVVVVVGPHEQPVRSALEGTSALVIPHPDWDAGRTGSIQRGLAVLDEPLDILLWPVDHPFVEESTVDLLLHAAGEDRVSLWWIPTFRERGGHPVLFRDEVRSKVAELPPDASLRSLLPGLGIFVRRLPVEDPGVVGSTDSPEEYFNALRAWRLRSEAL